MENINNNNNINTMNNNTMSNSSNDISSTIEPTMIKERQGETSRPGLQLYKSAARNLRDYHGVPSITAGGLEKTMALLQLRPARLVAQGLAPRKHLKAEAAMPDNSLGSSSRSSSSKSAVEEEKKEGEKENTGDASDCGDTNSSGTNISGTNSSSDDNDTESKHDLETEDRKHPVHAALAAAGIKLRPGEAKPLLLALGVHPHRLVKLGLVDREALLSSRRAALGRDIGRTRGGGRDQQCGPPRRRAHRGGGEGAGTTRNAPHPHPQPHPHPHPRRHARGGSPPHRRLGRSSRPMQGPHGPNEPLRLPFHGAGRHGHLHQDRRQPSNDVPHGPPCHHGRPNRPSGLPPGGRVHPRHEPTHYHRGESDGEEGVVVPKSSPIRGRCSPRHHGGPNHGRPNHGRGRRAGRGHGCHHHREDMHSSSGSEGGENAGMRREPRHHGGPRHHGEGKGHRGRHNKRRLTSDEEDWIGMMPEGPPRWPSGSAERHHRGSAGHLHHQVPPPPSPMAY